MFASNKAKIFGAVVVLAVVIGGAFYLMPPKVTDPNDPHFDPMDFRFDDYSKRDPGYIGKLDKALLGLKKEQLEKILEANGFKANPSSINTVYGEMYTYTKWGPKTSFTFNAYINRDENLVAYNSNY